ncbi:MAG: nucleotidyltransferase family protein [Acidobacteria bacterium]|nr:MAG: nucleotidyltransferase family protein [Acidobacteriota bacterium]
MAMKALILAAGYATRMYPLTFDRPKALLPVAGKPILDYLLEGIRQVREVENVIVVTNHKFLGPFRDWQRRLPDRARVQILDDGTTCNEGRLGAVADIRFALAQGAVDSDLLVMGADNIFHFGFAKFVDFFHQTGTDCIAVHIQRDRSKLARTGVAEVDENWRVTRFEEKPREPRSIYACPPFYGLLRASLRLLGEYLDQGNNADAPGYFIEWLVRRNAVHAFFFDEPRHAIGDLDSYRDVCQLFEGR